ncbi:GntR family transcriptional regulator [Roseateles sp. DAIF2]|uniref:GntR family transcriptional regulator n=1 Tax=Roseateles sp. DAIF2 TaxID=2714952 RepID=UPI0018A27F48|nr:GntR family transcriptional regulator [Roseateles sp. DAIF2]QPF71830.1 GntR family transcriptional regulator [Roseateles sp. DAIF2]
MSSSNSSSGGDGGEAFEWQSRVRLVDEVARVLRQRIYTGFYPPGELLRQVQLSEDLKVSRTPLREALRMLQSEGLVEADGVRGVSVARADRTRLLNAYALREMLDGLAARQAAERASDRARALLVPIIEAQRHTLDPWRPAEYTRLNVELHVAIVELADNEFLSAQLALVRKTSQVFAPAVLISQDRAGPAIQEHQRIVEAIAAGDGELAERLGRLHIQATIRCLRAEIAEEAAASAAARHATAA